MVIKRAIYPKEYNLTISQEQKAPLLEMLADMKKVVVQHLPPPPKNCPTCGQMDGSQWADTWGPYDVFVLQGKIEMLEVLLGYKDLIMDHT